MVFFAGLLLAGTLASGIVALEHRARPRLAKSLRAQAVWTHMLLLWPVPALLAVHIAKSYYF
jgi:nitrite reductase (NADH) large subunit